MSAPQTMWQEVQAAIAVMSRVGLPADVKTHASELAKRRSWAYGMAGTLARIWRVNPACIVAVAADDCLRRRR